MEYRLATKLVISAALGSPGTAYTRSVPVSDVTGYRGSLVVESMTTGVGAVLNTWLEYSNDNQNWISDPLLQAVSSAGLEQKTLSATSVATRFVRAKFQLTVTSASGVCVLSLSLNAALL